MRPSLPGVVDILSIPADPGGLARSADVLIEIPHGATTTEDYQSLAGELDGPLPAGLIDFFHVNTDAGAPELALAVAHALVARAPSRRVELLRSRIPRTFVDCNRRLDAAAAELEAGGVTPGLMPWVQTAKDRALLLARHRAYVAQVEAAAQAVMPAGLLLLLHTYAPRSVGVTVDGDIVPALHAAYRPEVEPTWPLRPPLDIIDRTPDGTVTSPPAVTERLVEAARGLGLHVGRNETYSLHDSTLAYWHATRWPGRVLCLEVRRDLLTEAFVPFVPVVISPAKVARLAEVIAQALLAALA